MQIQLWPRLKAMVLQFCMTGNVFYLLRMFVSSMTNHTASASCGQAWPEFLKVLRLIPSLGLCVYSRTYEY